MRPAWKRAVLAIAGVAVVAIVVVATVVLQSGSADQPKAAEQASGRPAPGSPGAAASEFLTAFTKGDTEIAGGMTTDPAAATAALRRVRTELAPQSVAATMNRAPTESSAGSFRISWTVGQGRTWTYDNPITVARSADHWAVRWSDALVHADFAPGRHLVVRSRAATPAVVDRDGTPLVNWTPAGAKPAVGDPAAMLGPAMARLASERTPEQWGIGLTDDAGTLLNVVYGTDSAAVAPLGSTLSTGVQGAAQSAVNGVGGPAMLVALQPSTGGILAVAQNPAAAQGRGALSGLYSPGSTFKIATATAAVQNSGAGRDTVLPCPGSAAIGQRTIPNDDGFDLGAVPLHTAFARSCNTTFATLAADLPADGLVKAADQLGLGADFDIPGVTTEVGSVPPAEDPVQRLEDGIGQGKVRASPFGVALMSATVAAGAPVTPKLWRDLPTAVTTGYQAVPATTLATLRPMMREVVTAGTASELGRFGEVYGKTGTAQLADPAQANGWFTGYRGDLAFAVLVEGAGSSGPAVSASGAFLGGLPR